MPAHLPHERETEWVYQAVLWHEPPFPTRRKTRLT